MLRGSLQEQRGRPRLGFLSLSISFPVFLLSVFFGFFLFPLSSEDGSDGRVSLRGRRIGTRNHEFVFFFRVKIHSRLPLFGWERSKRAPGMLGL